jgi:hypothetical protein
MDQNEHPLDCCHLGVPFGAPKKIFMHVVHSMQTMLLSCAEINTFSKQSQTSFHLTHVTKEYCQVCPRWFMSLWYVLHQPCTYLVLRLTLSPNRLKRASTWPTSPRSSIRCIQNNFWAYCTFGAKCVVPCVDINIVSKWIEMYFQHYA